MKRRTILLTIYSFALNYMILANEPKEAAREDEADERRILWLISANSTSGGQEIKPINAGLSKALLELKPEDKYQILCVAGGAFFLGDEVEYQGHRKPWKIVGGEGRDYRLEFFPTQHNALFTLKEGQQLAKASWLSIEDVPQSQQQIQAFRRISGSDWAAALETALSQEPAPTHLIFLTHGRHHHRHPLTHEQLAEIWGKKIQEKGIELRCLALVSLQSEKALRPLAEKTGGSLKLVQMENLAEELAP